MSNSNNTQKNYNTHNGTICWNDRPCYREQVCEYCLNRKIKFICAQIEPMVNEDNLCCFMTISFPNEFDPTEALNQVTKIRKSLHAILKQYGPYISVVALGETEDSFVPHIHSLCGFVQKELLESHFLKKCKVINFNLQIDFHDGNLARQANGRIGYMVKQNLRPTLYYKLKYQRLLTSSRGICTSRPRYLETVATMYKTEVESVL